MDKDAFKLRLQELIEKTHQEVAMMREATHPVGPDNAIGRISRMDAINNKGVNEASLRNLEQKLSGLEMALQNLYQDDFGKCAKCKADIPEGHILLMPHSRYCVKCAR